jgi:hypothetical protein
MLLTARVSQSAIGPYVMAAITGSVTHAVTAAAMLPSTKHQLGYAACSVGPHATYIARLTTKESAGVEANAVARFVTRSTFQLTRFWLKVDAELKMPYMFDTDATFQLEMSWLKADAEENM